MEASGTVFSSLSCFSGAGINARCSKAWFSVTSSRFPTEIRFAGFGDSKASSSSGFGDNGHLQYYHVAPRCDLKKEKEKDKGMTKTKKKLKLLRGLSRDLSLFSELGFGVNADDGLAGEVKGKMISEATDLLIRQLEQLRAEKKELKQKRKQEKANLKALRMKTRLECEASAAASSSSESSDDEAQVVDMSRLRAEFDVEPVLLDSKPVFTPEAANCSPTHKTSTVECCNGISNSNCFSSMVEGTSDKKIEVCMGNKCKKSGGAELMEEFQRAVGVEGAVVGCKCMGKCRNGPNVKVLNNLNEIQAKGLDDSVKTPANPLYIGVGLGDVNAIVAKFLGEDRSLLEVTALA